jgi:hypothetical protein
MAFIASISFVSFEAVKSGVTESHRGVELTPIASQTALEAFDPLLPEPAGAVIKHVSFFLKKRHLASRLLTT